MMDKILIIGIAVVVLIIIIVIVSLAKKKKENGDEEASILDIDEVGVPNTSELKDFSYGYEKEETIVMNPVKEENEMDKSEKNE